MIHHYNTYTDFLSDRKFIQWQLLPDDELNIYWADFIKCNPHLKAEIDKASLFLKTSGLNRPLLSDFDRTDLLKRIISSVELRKRRSERNIWRNFYAVASIAVVVVIVGMLLFLPKKETQLLGTENGIIVGNIINGEDVQLIVGKDALTFDFDVDIDIDEIGTATVTRTNSNDKKQYEVKQQSVNKLVVPFGKRSQLTLSDGSKVWINSGSIVEFPTRFNEEERDIYLVSGEIFLDVAVDKNRVFNVHTSNFMVKVHGTKFNLSAYSDSPQSVVLVEGVVGLQSAGNKEILMSPNEQAVYTTNGKFNKQIVDTERYVSWKNGYLTLVHTPMTEVLSQIGRYYNLSFDYEQDVDLHNRTCTGKINLSENMDNVLSAIGVLTSTKFKKENNRIYISGN